MQNDPENQKKIIAEIEALQKKIGTTDQATAQTPAATTAENQPPLGINEPSPKLPERQPLEEIEGPSTTPAVSPSPAATVTPEP